MKFKIFFSMSMVVLFSIFLSGCLLNGIQPNGPQVVVNDYRHTMSVNQPAGNKSDAEGNRPYSKPRIHGMGTMDNPSVVIFRARDDGWTREVIVNDGNPIVVQSGEATANQYLPFGEHKIVIRKWRDIPPFGKTQASDKVLAIQVHPEGYGAQIVPLY